MDLSPVEPQPSSEPSEPQVLQQLRKLEETLSSQQKHLEQALEHLRATRQELPDRLAESLTRTLTPLPDRIAEAVSQTPLQRAPDTLDEILRRIADALDAQQKTLDSLLERAASDRTEENLQRLIGAVETAHDANESHVRLIEQIRDYMAQGNEEMVSIIHEAIRSHRRTTIYIAVMLGVLIFAILLHAIVTA